MTNQNDPTNAYKHTYASGWFSGYLYAKKKRLRGADVLLLHKKAMDDYDEIYGEKSNLITKPTIKKHKIRIKEYGVKNGKTIEI
jgi:hypothetical protein